jgi:hypothetical protein
MSDEVSWANNPKERFRRGGFTEGIRVSKYGTAFIKAVKKIIGRESILMKKTAGVWGRRRDAVAIEDR